MGKARTRILIGDRNPLVGEALMALFADIDGSFEVACASSLDAALAATGTARPDLVLIDAWIGKVGMEQVVRQIKASSPASSVFVMASKCDDGFRRRASLAGAMGCCEKEAVPAAARGMLDSVRKR